MWIQNSGEEDRCDCVEEEDKYNYILKNKWQTYNFLQIKNKFTETGGVLIYKFPMLSTVLDWNMLDDSQPQIGKIFRIICLQS